MRHVAEIIFFKGILIGVEVTEGSWAVEEVFVR